MQTLVKHKAAANIIISFFLALFGFVVPSHAHDNRQIPSEYTGRWAKRCGDLNSPAIEIEKNRVTVKFRAESLTYSGVDFSYTYGEGFHASGRYNWILVSKAPDRMYAFVLTVPGAGRTGPIMLENGVENEGREVRELSGVKFLMCHQ